MTKRLLALLLSLTLLFSCAGATSEDLLDWVLEGIEDFNPDGEEILEAPPAEELTLEDLLREPFTASALFNTSALRNLHLQAEGLLDSPRMLGLTAAGLLMMLPEAFQPSPEAAALMGQLSDGEAVMVILDAPADQMTLIRFMPGEDSAEAFRLELSAADLSSWYAPAIAALVPMDMESLPAYQEEIRALERRKASLTVSEVTFEISPNRQSVYIDRPTIKGGSGKYTIAYNIYDSDSQPVNYFYSAEKRVAATPGYAGLFNVFVVVTDTNTHETNTQNIGWHQLADETTGQPLQVSGVSFEISPDRRSIFIDRPEIRGGSGIRTIAYNIYDADSNPVNYFYSNERRVAATPGYDGRFNVFIVVTDSGTGEQNIQDIGWQALGEAEQESWPAEINGVFYNKMDDTVYIYGGDESRAELQMQDAVFGYPVTRITYGSFDGFTSLKRLSLPATLREIGARAFAGCTALTGYASTGRLYLPESLTVIGEEAFSGCKALKKVTARDGLTTIGAKAFASSALKEIELPASVQNIAEDAFSGCKSLVVYGQADSYPDLWCAQHNIAFKPLGEGRAQNLSSNLFQDTRSFAYDQFEYGNNPIEDWDDCTLLAFNCTQDDKPKLEALVQEAACGKYNYELVGVAQSTYNWGFCWILRYTGTARTTTELSNQYDSSMVGHVKIWMWNPNFAGQKCNVHIAIAKGLSYGDLGMRLLPDNTVIQQGLMWKQPPTLNSVAQTGRGQVRVVWTPQADANCYSVYEIVNGSTLLRQTVTGTECTLINVPDGVHAYVVRPRSSTGGDAVFGEFSEAMSVTVGETYVPPQSASSLLVQDFKSFAQERLNFGVGVTPNRGPKMSTFSFECAEKDIDIMHTYVEMLTSGSYNFKLHHYQQETNRVAEEWLLTYTGTGQTGEKIPGQHNGNYSGDVLVWYYMPSPFGTRTIKAYVYISGGVDPDTHQDFGLQFADLGLRCDGTNVNVPQPETPVGTPSIEVQDPRFFAEALNWGDEKVYDTYTLIPFSGKASQRTLLQRYVDRVGDGKHNFSVNPYYEDSTGRFGSWSLPYYGTGEVAEPRGQMYISSYYGHMTVYFAVDGSSMNGQIAISRGLEFIDQGMRADGNDVVIERIGISSNASLIQLSDGRYGTSDGRFQVYPGRAQIWRDSARYDGGITMVRKPKSGMENFLINGYFMSECFALVLPWNQLQTGDEYSAKDLGLSSSTRYVDVTAQSGFFSHTWTKMLGACHGKDYLYLHYPPKNDFRDAIVRVMLWDEQRDICVLYIAAAFSTAPYLTECLAAVPISSAENGDDHSEHITITNGSTTILSYDSHALEQLSEVYKWEIVSGADVVSFTGSTTLSTCRVTGVKPGKAVVRVSYTYSFYEPNVLTGNRQFGFNTWVHEYEITVTR